MDQVKEALGRIVIAEFEERQKKALVLVRAARWRKFALVLQLAAIVAWIIYVDHSQPPGWARALIFPLGLYLLFTALNQHRAEEELRTIRVEIEQLRIEAEGRRSD